MTTQTNHGIDINVIELELYTAQADRKGAIDALNTAISDISRHSQALVENPSILCDLSSIATYLNRAEAAKAAMRKHDAVIYALFTVCATLRDAGIIVRDRFAEMQKV